MVPASNPGLRAGKLRTAPTSQDESNTQERKTLWAPMNSHESGGRASSLSSWWPSGCSGSYLLYTTEKLEGPRHSEAYGQGLVGVFAPDCGSDIAVELDAFS